MPPTRPARAETADSCRPVSIVVFTGAPGLRFGFGEGAGRAVRVARRPAASPPGLPARRALKACSSPRDADRRVRGEALAGERLRVVFFGRADFAGDVDRLAADRVGARFRRTLGERRAVGGEDRGPRGELDLAFQVLACGAGRGRRGSRPTRCRLRRRAARARLRPGRRRRCRRRSAPARRSVRPAGARRRRASRLRASAASRPRRHRGRRVTKSLSSIWRCEAGFSSLYMAANSSSSQASAKRSAASFVR